MQQELAEVSASLRTAAEKIEKLVKAEKPKLPNNVPPGYELTGEYRIVCHGEDYLLGSSKLSASCSNEEYRKENAPKWILRKVVGPTIEDLYGDSLVNLKAPDGFEFTGEFRCVNDGEMVLGSNSFSRPCGALRWQSVGDVPRLILVPIPKPKRMVFEVVDGPYATTGMYNGYSICWNGKYLRFLREE
jgi:hypothetical protein